MENKKKIALLGLNRAQLEQLALENGESSYRGRQIYDWLYKKWVHNLDDITVLPKPLRQSLSQQGISVGCLNELDSC